MKWTTKKLTFFLASKKIAACVIQKLHRAKKAMVIVLKFGGQWTVKSSLLTMSFLRVAIVGRCIPCGWASG